MELKAEDFTNISKNFSNVEFVIVDGTLEISPLAITIKADDKTKVYDNDESTDPALTATVTGVPEKGVAPVYSVSRVKGQDADSYVITVTAEAASNPNYTVKVESGTFTITPKEITISAVDAGKVYGEKDPELTATVTGVPEKGTAPEYSLSREVGENVGTYEITVTPGSNRNYTVKVDSGTFTITPAKFPENPDDEGSRFDVSKPEKVVYNGKEQKQPLTITDKETGKELVEGTDFTLRYSEDVTNVGTVTVMITGKGNYSGEMSRTYEITKRPVTITADDKSKVYGEEDPELTAKVDNAVEGETVNYTLSRKEGENAGEYPITVTSGENPNYEVTVKDGTFTIEKTSDELTVSVDGAAFMYDGQPHSNTNKPVVNVEDAKTVVEYSVDGETWTKNLSDIAATNVSDSVTIQIRATNANYEKTAAGTTTLTILPRTVVLQSGSSTRNYNGQPLQNTKVTVSGDGFAAGEGIKFINFASRTAPGSTQNTFTYQAAPGTDLANYNIVAAYGTLTVTQRVIPDVPVVVPPVPPVVPAVPGAPAGDGLTVIDDFETPLGVGGVFNSMGTSFE